MAVLQAELPMCCAPSNAGFAPPCSPHAPSLLPLKQPCSLSRTETAIPNPKFGMYIMYIYYINP